VICRGKNAKGNPCQNEAMDGIDLCRYHQNELDLRPSDGTFFEEEVMKILRILGYKVQRNILLNNCQIDIYAEAKIGIITHRLAVECKDYGPNKNVGIEDLNKFVGVIATARAHGAVDKGLFVTTNGFTSSAKAYAITAGIDAITYPDLSTQLINVDDYIDTIVSDYEESDVSKYYIDLTGTDVEDYETNINAKKINPIEQNFSQLLDEPSRGKIALLGNFGTGKTTFCKKYSYDLALRYKKDKTKRIPILINLKDYDSRFDIQHLILNTLQNKYGLNISMPIFQTLQKAGKMLFLLDGFDEMDARAGSEVIKGNLRELNKLSEVASNRMIITCRTHFFKNKVQTKMLSEFNLIYVPEWSEVELEEYLQKRFRLDWPKTIDRILGTLNLRELARTPLFLDMIAGSLPKLGDNVKRVQLYRVYTDNWIENQSYRKGALLLPEERKQFVKELALKLYLEKRLTCNFSEFPKILKQFLRRLKNEEYGFDANDLTQIEYLKNDVQNCTFLTRDSEGNYAFKHKSFMEYFVALNFFDELQIGYLGHIKLNLIPVEIRAFLIDMLREGSFESQLKKMFYEARETILLDNLTNLISFLGLKFLNDGNGLSIRSMDIRPLGSLFLQGKIEAFDEIYRRYRDQFFKRLDFGKESDLRLELLHDCIIEGFLAVWERRELIENAAYIPDIIFRRICGIHHKKIKEEIKYSALSNIEDEIEPFELPKQIETIFPTEHITLDEAIKKLGDQERTMIIDRYVLQMSITELVDKFKLSRPILLQTLVRIKDKIRKYMIENQDNDLDDVRI